MNKESIVGQAESVKERLIVDRADQIIINSGHSTAPTQEAENKVLTLKIQKREAAKQGKVVTFFKSEQVNPTSKFVTACNTVKVPPSLRQASKWLNKKGAAWKEANHANY